MNVKKLVWICLTGALISCNPADATKEKEKVEVRVGKAESYNAASERNYTIISKPYQATSLSFRVGGPIEQFDGQAGQFYKKGEIIACIDDRDFKIRKTKAEAMCQQAAAEYNRISNLYQKNNISGSIYEKAKADYAAAQAAYETTVNELNDTRLKAPFDGYIQEINIERYQEVKPSQTVVSLIDLSKIKVEAYIPENMAIYLKKNPTANYAITFHELGGQSYTPAETYISQSTTNNNISFLLTALVENSDKKLLGGMTGEISLSIPIEAHQSVVLIPQIAVSHQAGIGTFVWKVDAQNRVTKHPVEIGDLHKGNKIEIRRGVKPGETIALTNLSFLTEHTAVTTQ